MTSQVPAPDAAARPAYGLIAVAAAGHFLNDAMGNVYPVLIPLVMTPLHLTLVAAALVTTANRMSQSVLQPFVGRFTDRGSRLGLVLPAALGLGAVTTGLLPFTAAAWLFLVLALVAGASNAAFHPPALTWVRAIGGSSRRGRSMSLFLVAGNLGRAVAPLVLGALAIWLGVSAIAWLALPGLLLAIWYVPRLRGYRVAGGGSGEELPALGLIRRRLGDTLSLLAMTAARATLSNSVIVLVPIAYKVAGEPVYLGAAVVGVLLLAGSLGNVVGGSLSDLMPREWVVIVAALTSAGALVGFLLTHGVASLVFVALTGLFSGSTNSVTVVIGQEIFPESVGMASGIALGLGNAVATALVALLSVLAGATSVTVALLTAGGIALLAVPAAIRHRRAAHAGVA
jgi:FSR family fosmidomycin resistance protein-like MFS transporter